MAPGAQSLERRHGQMAVEVVPVRRVDVGAQPHARVGDVDTVAADPLGDARGRLRGAGAGTLLEPERRAALERAPLEPRGHERVVVVAGQQHDLGVRGQRGADALEHGARRVDGVDERTVAQLEDVAEQDEPVDVAERGLQRCTRLRKAQHVGLRPAGEVQVGEDERPHAAPTAGR
jgi:hypothetical protein